MRFIFQSNNFYGFLLFPQPIVLLALGNNLAKKKIIVGLGPICGSWSGKRRHAFAVGTAKGRQQKRDEAEERTTPHRWPYSQLAARVRPFSRKHRYLGQMCGEMLCSILAVLIVPSCCQPLYLATNCLANFCMFTKPLLALFSPPSYRVTHCQH